MCLAVLLLLPTVAGALLVPQFATTPLPLVQSRSTSTLEMASRYEDGDDKRLSSGGSGSRWGRFGGGNKNKRLGVGGTESFASNNIRQQKLDAYVNNDYEAADRTFTKIIAGSFLVTLFTLLYGVYAYYGGEGLISATQRM